MTTMVLKMGRLSRIIWLISLITQVLKLRELLLAIVKRDATVLVFKMAEGATSQGMQVDSRGWKAKEMIHLESPLKGMQPANTLILHNKTMLNF